MKRYIKNGVVKYENEIIITTEGKNTINPTEEQIIADGWEEYIPEPYVAPVKTEPSHYQVKEALVELMLPKAKETFETLDDQSALKVKALADTWESFIGKEVKAKKKLYYDDRLYKVRQTHQVQEIYKPGAEGTEALYEEINEINSGTREDPIPYNNNMRLELGKFYIQEGVIYECIRDSEVAVFQPLLELVDIYVKVVQSFV